MQSTIFCDSSKLVEILRRCVPRAGPENILAEDVRKALREAQIEFSQEAKLSKGRVDLRVGSVAVELKVQGSAPSVLRQLARYSSDPTVTEVILLTTSRKISSSMPATLGGKTLHVIYLMRV